MSEPRPSVSPRNPGFEEAVEVMALALSPVGRTNNPDGDYRRELARKALTALLDAKQTETCETCGGDGVARTSPRTFNEPVCPDCTDGRVKGTVPLVLLGGLEQVDAWSVHRKGSSAPLQIWPGNRPTFDHPEEWEVRPLFRRREK